MQKLHLETLLWLLLPGSPCCSVALPLLSLVRKKRGLGNGSSMAKMGAKVFSPCSPNILDPSIFGVLFFTCILLFFW